LGRNRVGTHLLVNPTELLENEPLIALLKEFYPVLHLRLQHEVIPAAVEIANIKEKIKDLEQIREGLTRDFERARATIKANIPRLEAEIVGGFNENQTTIDNPINRIDKEGLRRGLIAESKEGKRLLGLISAGLSIPNFIALCELIDVPFTHLTIETLIYVPLCLSFSMSASVGVHLGLTRFIRATRDYIVDGSKPLITNLFPYGIKDKAVIATLIIIVCDTLFSSVGLLIALPPNVREELFWQISIVFVSALASVINVLLAWGVAQQRISIDLRFKHEGAVEQEQVKAYEKTLGNAQEAYRKLVLVDEKLRRCYFELQRQESVAYQSYWLWHKALQARRREYRVITRRDAFIAERKIRLAAAGDKANKLQDSGVIGTLEPATNGHSKHISLSDSEL